jgi:hypothetical protein
MIEANCPKCGSRFYGWALRFPRNQYCSQCGSALNIIEDKTVTKGYSPFEAEKYIYDKHSEKTISPEQTHKPEIN